MTAAHSPRTVIAAYISSSLLFTLATSLIWATNTIFMMQVGGLDIFQVMLVNAIFVVAQAVFEVPTGVIADTLGRKASYLIGIGTILASTLLYVATPRLGWGFWGFSFASVLIGLGFTFQTGAVDAWLVDALDSVGYDEPKDRVFARGAMTSGVGMLVGSLLGGLFGQVNLALPYLLRALLLVAVFVLVAVLFSDLGFERRALSVATFGTETRSIFSAGVQFGWRDRVVRPLLFVSMVGGVFYMYGFYSWQPYVLGLLGKNAVWTLGIVQAGLSLTSIAGNALVKPIMRTGARRRDPARVLAWTAVVGAILVCGDRRGRTAHAATGCRAVLARGGVVAGVGRRVRSLRARESGVPQREHPLGAACHGPVPLGVLRRRRWRRWPAGAGLGVSADVDRRRLAHRRGVPWADGAALPHGRAGRLKRGPRRGLAVMNGRAAEKHRS